MVKNFRPGADEYFLKIAMVVSERSTCLRRNNGAVIVKDKQVLSTGYNGAVSGAKDCLELGCRKDQLKIPRGSGQEECRASHSEMNAIVQAAKHGTNIGGATIYSTLTPCMICARAIVNAGIKKYVTFSDYADKHEFLALFEEVGIEFVKMSEPTFSKENALKRERVLVVLSKEFDKVCSDKGLITKDIKKIYNFLLENSRFIERDAAENNTEYKQIIPQNVIRYEDKYFLMKKLSKSRESRLHDLFHLGAGGHIDLADANDKEGDVITKGMLRELDEELNIKVKNFDLKG